MSAAEWRAVGANDSGPETRHRKAGGPMLLTGVGKGEVAIVIRLGQLSEAFECHIKKYKLLFCRQKKPQ